MDHEAERALIARALGGDEAALATMVDTVYPVLRRLAAAVVRDRALAEEAVQDALVAMVDRLETFEGRSSLKTWACRILVNGATKKLAREGRSRPFSAIGDDEPPSDRERTVDPARFGGTGFWAAPPARTMDPITPEDLALRREVGELLSREIDALPEAQRLVVTMRDVEGWEAEEVCNVLEVSEVHQRVLLHRARAKLRAALERYLGGAP